jgi:transposase
VISLVWERGREAKRLQKVLEDANIKLASVASRPLGVSGKAMLKALCDGESDPEALADLAKGKLRGKLPALRAALEGRFREHHALLVSHLLAHIEYLEETINSLSAEIEERVRPFARQVELLCTIPGVDERTAEVIIAELGPTWSAFQITATPPAGWRSAPETRNPRASERRARPARATAGFARRSSRPLTRPLGAPAIAT